MVCCFRKIKKTSISLEGAVDDSTPTQQQNLYTLSATLSWIAGSLHSSKTFTHYLQLLAG
jgi:hypothetical protein